MKTIIEKLNEITMEDIKAALAAICLVGGACFNAWLFS